MTNSMRQQMAKLSRRDLSQEFDCLNSLQRTAWTINKPLLEIVRTLWDNGQEWAGLPAREDIPLPMYPFDKDPQEMNEAEKEKLAAWSKNRREIYRINNRSVSKRIQIERTMQMAEEYAKHDRFYYVWQNDFRSRKYASSTFMSPQGADWSKAFMMFKHGMPINNWDDARWLCIHGANLYGNDKVTLNERETWAWDNADEFKRVVDNPFDNLYWLEADKPFQFLAWCMDFVGLVRQGWGYESRIPVSADGSCNGLQHLSAILRDERGGKATNLIPADLPQDIYSEVASDAMRAVERDASEGSEVAQQCKQLGIDRSVCKRPVMIVPYSGTRFACRQYIEDALKEKITKGADNPFGDDLFTPSNYLAGHVWDSINGVIQSARQVMDYVKEVGDCYADHNMHMEWVTPTNFLVMQHYKELNKKRIKTYINGSVVSLVKNEEREDEVSKRRAGNGSSPNFIHSLDAAAMTKTINECRRQGIDNFAMVHDSYGTHSTLMPKMSDILREEFVKMYEQHDVLTELRDHAKVTIGTDDIPHPPSVGNLDIRNVLKSQYFFA